MLWANLHLLFWLSLLPFVTAWASESHFARDPVALYGFVLLGAAFAYSILVVMLLRAHEGETLLRRAIGNDFKGKISIVGLSRRHRRRLLQPLARLPGLCRRRGDVAGPGPANRIAAGRGLADRNAIQKRAVIPV